MTLKNLIAAIKYQGFKEFFISKNGWGIFSKNSHINQHTGGNKVCYNTEASAQKAAASMNKKYGGNLVPYKCAFCDGYHIGNNK
jgi:hypothetical protein